MSKHVKTRPTVLAGLLSLVFTPIAAAQPLFQSGFEQFPDVVLTKIAPEATNASEITYTIEYFYPPESIVPAENLVLTDAIPAGTNYVAMSATGGGLFSDGAVTWHLPNLNPGDSGSESFQVSVLSDGLYENTAELTFSRVVVRMVTSNTTVTQRDTEPPVVTIIGPDGATTDGTTTYDSTPTFEYNLDGDPVTVECKVDLESYAPCPLPLGMFTPAPLSEGMHTVYIRAIDLAGNVGSAARTFLYEEPPPDVVLTKIAPEATNASLITYTIEYAYPANSTVPAENLVLTDAIPVGTTYVLMSATGDGMFSDGTVTWNLPNLDPGDSGSESFQVAVLDDGMYENTAELTFSHVIERMVSSNTTVTHRDTEPPVVTIIGPDGATMDGATTIDSTPTFEYQLAGDPVVVECRVDLGMYEPCPLPLGMFTAPPLSIGMHTVYVRATDLAGNTGTYARSFLVDAPDIFINPPSNRVGEDLQVSFEVSLEVAPTSTLQVYISVQSASLAMVSSDPLLTGSGDLMINFPAGTTSQFLYLQGSSSGTTNLSAEAAGYNSGNMNAIVDPSGFIIISPASIDTSVGAENTDITICAARLDPVFLTWQEVQPIRGGLFVPVALDIPDPGVGVVSPNPVTFTPNLDCANTQFDPIGPGNTFITLSTPAGFETPSFLQSIPVQVTP